MFKLESKGKRPSIRVGGPLRALMPSAASETSSAAARRCPGHRPGRRLTRGLRADSGETTRMRGLGCAMTRIAAAPRMPAWAARQSHDRGRPPAGPCRAEPGQAVPSPPPASRGTGPASGRNPPPFRCSPLMPCLPPFRCGWSPVFWPVAQRRAPSPRSRLGPRSYRPQVEPGRARSACPGAEDSDITRAATREPEPGLRCGTRGSVGQWRQKEVLGGKHLFAPTHDFCSSEKSHQ